MGLMAVQRFISSSFWTDKWVRSMDPLERYLYLYLLTNTETNIAGIYKVTLDRISFDTGLDEAYVQSAFDKFAAEGKVHYVNDEWVVIPAWPAHQRVGVRNNIRKGIDGTLAKLPEEVWTALKGLGYRYEYLEDHPRSSGDSGRLGKTSEGLPKTSEGLPKTSEDFHRSSEDFHKSSEGFELLDTDTDTDTDSDTDAPSGKNLSPLEKEVKHLKYLADQRGDITYPDYFETWWQAYPNPQGKKRTLQCYALALEAGATKDELLTAAQEYAKRTRGEERKYLKHSTTFLGPKEPWRDYLEAEKPRSEDGFRYCDCGRRLIDGKCSRCDFD